MSSPEARIQNRQGYDPSFHAQIVAFAADRRADEPSESVKAKKAKYAAMAARLKEKLDDQNLTLSAAKRARMEWNMEVMLWRAARGPKVQGLKRIPLPSHIAIRNPQLPRTFSANIRGL